MRVCEESSLATNPGAAAAAGTFDRASRLADLRRCYQRGAYRVQLTEVSARLVDDHLSA